MSTPPPHHTDPKAGPPAATGSHANDHDTGILLLRCVDQPGLVAEVAGFIAGHGGNITDADQHTERSTNRFFQRVEFETAGMDLAPGDIEAAFEPIATRLGITTEFHLRSRRTRVAILASRLDHCVLDLLHRWTTGELPMEPVAVISNHADVASVAGWFDIAFHHLAVTPDTRADQERRLQDLLDMLGVELVVLARYMQILSPGFCERWENRCINIHHSFLPAFAGAQPYHQAHARGVKVIGATAHYITAELDAGPIISQGVADVTHRHDVEDFVRKGRELETTVLARAVGAHLDWRVLVDGDRTVVFD